MVTKAAAFVQWCYSGHGAVQTRACIKLTGTCCVQQVILANNTLLMPIPVATDIDGSKDTGC
jgi:hypothetical protein